MHGSPPSITSKTTQGFVALMWCFVSRVDLFSYCVSPKPEVFLSKIDVFSISACEVSSGTSPMLCSSLLSSGFILSCISSKLSTGTLSNLQIGMRSPTTYTNFEGGDITCQFIFLVFSLGGCLLVGCYSEMVDGRLI